MRLLSTAILSLTAATAFAAAGLAQTAAPAPAARPAAPAAAAKPPAKPTGPAWLSGCQADSRTAQLTCAMEQRLGLQTGQQLAAMVIQVPGATRQPNMILQLPLGMDLTAGATLQIDANPAVRVPIKSCDQNGCVATMALPAATLAQMQVAKAMTLTVQGNNKPVKVPFTMTGFAQTYEKIK